MVEKYKHVIPDAYEKADQMIGKVINTVQDAVIMVISDHGSAAMESLRTSYRLHVENFLNRFKLREKVIPAHLGPMVLCYFQDKDLMNIALPILKKINFIDTGEKIFDVHQKESLLVLRFSKSFWGKEIDGERIIDLGKFGKCKFYDLFLQEKMEVSGTHIEKGMFIMSGPVIKKGFHITGASIYDITPTALAVAGFPVAGDMDGKVLEPAIEDGFLKDHPITNIESYEKESDKRIKKETEEIKYDQIKERLKDLGYI